jgi:hypothetical protein
MQSFAAHINGRSLWVQHWQTSSIHTFFVVRPSAWSCPARVRKEQIFPAGIPPWRDHQSLHMPLAGTNLPNEQPEISGASVLYAVTLHDAAENQAYLYQAGGPNARGKLKQAFQEPGKLCSRFNGQRDSFCPILERLEFMGMDS